MSASAPEWTLERAADQRGRVAVVTGANTGIGLAVALALAGLGATVVLACRNPTAAEAAVARIRETVPEDDLHTVALDLADGASIAACARRVRERWPAVHLLIHNAGIMARHRTRTVDGFETDLAVNALGQFALTAQLFEVLEAAEAARVVTVNSLTHRRRNAALDFADLDGEREFHAGAAYGRSKMAAMALLFELDRRLRAAGASTTALAAHPGGVRTEILREQALWMRVVYHPRLAPLTGRRLWRIAEDRTGVRFPLAPADPDASV